MKSKEKYNQYHKKYNKRVYHERIQLAIKTLGGKCKFCESTENLQIDHIAPIEKKYDIDYATRLSLEKFLTEINKCQLLCDKCHGFKTAIQNGNRNEHGGGVAGIKHCKCQLCKNKRKEYMHKYMKERRLKKYLARL